MNEEFLAKKQQKLKIDIEELKTQWSEFEVDGKEMGFEGEALEQHVMYRINKYYLKLEREPIIEGRFQPLSVDKTDYGIIRQYQKAVEMFNKDSESAISEGLCTSNGIPIQQSGFNKGKPIDLENAFTIVYEGFFLEKNKEEKIKIKFRVGGKNIDSFNFDLGNIYDIKGIKSNKTNEDGSILVIGKTEYIPKLFAKRPYEDIKKDIMEYFESRTVSIKDIEKFYHHCMEKGESYPLAVVKGDIYNLNIIEDKEENGVVFERNNRIEIMHMDENSEIYTIGGWVPKAYELRFNFSENSQDIILIGTIREREDKNTNQKIVEFSKVSGIFVPDNFKKNGKEKPVEDTEEVTEEDVEKWVNKNTPL